MRPSKHPSICAVTPVLLRHMRQSPKSRTWYGLSPSQNSQPTPTQPPVSLSGCSMIPIIATSDCLLCLCQYMPRLAADLELAVLTLWVCLSDHMVHGACTHS